MRRVSRQALKYGLARRECPYGFYVSRTYFKDSVKSSPPPVATLSRVRVRAHAERILPVRRSAVSTADAETVAVRPFVRLYAAAVDSLENPACGWRCRPYSSNG